MGRVQGYQEEIQIQPAPGTTSEAGLGPSKRQQALTARFCQLKTGHCLTGQYFAWTKKQPTAKCWWRRCGNQTREHLSKYCPCWKYQQKILWDKVRRETGEVRPGHDPGLFANVRCSQPILDFLSTTDVGS